MGNTCLVQMLKNISPAPWTQPRRLEQVPSDSGAYTVMGAASSTVAENCAAVLLQTSATTLDARGEMQVVLCYFIRGLHMCYSVIGYSVWRNVKHLKNA